MNSWIAHLWELCDDSNIQITTTTTKLVLAKKHDQFLMDKFAAFGYRKTQLTQLNMCRLWCKVCKTTKLSDITTGDGNRIHPASWAGQPNKSAGSENKWPTQGRPTNTSFWKLGKEALQNCFLTLEMTQQKL
jgi:hypothetical protein